MSGLSFQSARTGDPKLEEFPLGVMTIDAPAGRKEIRYGFTTKVKQVETEYQLTIMGKQEGQLPCSGDIEILLALIHLSKAEDCHARTLSVTRYGIVRTLNWSSSGLRYDRIEAALTRWQETTAKFETIQREGGDETRIAKTFSLISKVQTSEPPAAGKKSSRVHYEITWGEVLWKALQQGSWRTVDLALALRLRPLARQLLCFAGCRFREKESFQVDLRELAHEHLGLSRALRVSRILQQLRRAIEELEQQHCIKPAEKAQRFFRNEAENWQVRFEKSEVLPPAPAL